MFWNPTVPLSPLYPLPPQIGVPLHRNIIHANMVKMIKTHLPTPDAMSTSTAKAVTKARQRKMNIFASRSSYNSLAEELRKLYLVTQVGKCSWSTAQPKATQASLCSNQLFLLHEISCNIFHQLLSFLSIWLKKTGILLTLLIFFLAAFISLSLKKMFVYSLILSVCCCCLCAHNFISCFLDSDAEVLFTFTVHEDRINKMLDFLAKRLETRWNLANKWHK